MGDIVEGELMLLFRVELHSNDVKVDIEALS